MRPCAWALYAICCPYRVMYGRFSCALTALTTRLAKGRAGLANSLSSRFLAELEQMMVPNRGLQHYHGSECSIRVSWVCMTVLSRDPTNGIDLCASIRHTPLSLVESTYAAMCMGPLCHLMSI